MTTPTTTIRRQPQQSVPSQRRRSVVHRVAAAGSARGRVRCRPARLGERGARPPAAPPPRCTTTARHEMSPADRAAAMLATAGFQDVATAEAAGYGSSIDTLGCFQDPTQGRHGPALHQPGSDRRHPRSDQARGARLRVRPRRQADRSRRPRVHRPDRRVDLTHDRRACSAWSSTATPRCRCGCSTPGSGRTTRAGCSTTGTRRFVCAQPASRSSVSICPSRRPTRDAHPPCAGRVPVRREARPLPVSGAGLATTAARAISLRSRTCRCSSATTNVPRSRRSGVALAPVTAASSSSPANQAPARRRWCSCSPNECADDAPVLWGACDPLSTPRPLGPLHDVANELDDAARDALRDAAQPHEIFTAVHEYLCNHPSVLVVDDLHWADQGTVDLLRFLLRRVGSTRTLLVGTVRDDELDVSHPMRALLGDVARSPHAITMRLQPLSVAAIATMIDDRPVDPRRIEQLTGGNPFFVGEMLAHSGDDLPTSVRDAILSRTTQLDADAWDLLHLLACAPEAIPDHLLASLDVGLLPLRALDRAGLIRRGTRGVAFRHDLCRLAIATTVPPGADAAIHQRMIVAIEGSAAADPAVLVHHSIGAGDRDRVLRYAIEAARSAARSGAHTQAAAFYRIALASGRVGRAGAGGRDPRVDGRRVLPHRSARARHRRVRTGDALARADRRSGWRQREPSLARRVRVVQRQPLGGGSPCERRDHRARRRRADAQRRRARPPRPRARHGGVPRDPVERCRRRESCRSHVPARSPRAPAIGCCRSAPD